MIRFTRRLFGFLAFDARAYEEVESDPAAAGQAVLVALLVCAAGGAALASRYALTWPAFAAASAAMVAGWAVWVGTIRLLGTGILAEPQTRSSTPELLRTLGFAGAPGLFYVFAVITPAAPFVLSLASLWMIATTVMGVRQALDFRSTVRAGVVCAAAWLLSFGVIAMVALALSRPVS